MTEEEPPSSPPAARAGDSILDSIARRTGRTPSVNLPSAPNEGSAPLIDAKARSFQDELSNADQGKYRILGEIARGGMGVVLHGHDVELGREVAMKVASAELAQRPEVVERFIEEAQIGGQLQHPGIVPVYELGLMADERPYFTMKLIKGRTLTAMLSRRKSPGEDRIRFLRIFESVCQTMAYAHSKGVIHRDLKPANIMVGAFGEVQVVDWGLSKVLARGGVADEIEARDEALSMIATVRSGPGSGSDSIVGNVLGTPAYMSPEQAQGDVTKLDERTDVFALGSMLCEILTGQPAYVAKEGEHLVQLAAQAKLDDARTRLDASEAADELKELCRAALTPAREARPRDAEELAGVLQEHLSGLERRAHDERLNAERSRRQTQLSVFAGLFSLLVLGGGGGTWWYLDNQRQERRADLAAAFSETRSQVLAHEREGDFERALEASRAGVRLVESGGADPELETKAAELLATTRARWQRERDRIADERRQQELLQFFENQSTLHMLPGDSATSEDVNEEYKAALREFGIDFDADDLDAQLTVYRDTPLGRDLAFGFDGWGQVLRGKQRERMTSFRPVAADANQDPMIDLLSGIGLDLDPDPWRNRVREAHVSGDPGGILELAYDEELTRADPETLALLAGGLLELGQFRDSLRVLRLSLDTYPDEGPLARDGRHLPSRVRQAQPLRRRGESRGLPPVRGRVRTRHRGAALASGHGPVGARRCRLGCRLVREGAGTRPRVRVGHGHDRQRGVLEWSIRQGSRLHRAQHRRRAARRPRRRRAALPAGPLERRKPRRVLRLARRSPEPELAQVDARDASFDPARARWRTRGPRARAGLARGDARGQRRP